MTPTIPTPGQTVGPFFGYSLHYEDDNRLVPLNHPEAVRLRGAVYDGLDAPVPDALIEIWQLAPDGSIATEPGSLHRDGYTFTGWGRCATDATGHYSFSTLRPGASTGGSSFFAMTVLARGLLDRLLTRVYLPGSEDALLSSLPEDRRHTLMATADEHGFVFDVRLQGEGETVFLTHSEH